MDLSDALPTYYSNYYPFQDFFRWLNHSYTPTKDFTNREFAFTLENDAYLRYQSFDSAEAFKREVRRLNPSRFEVGPVYSSNPKLRKTATPGTFKPLSKELVFDIDLTDYDSVRTCCHDKQICIKCWQFVTAAIAIMDSALRQDFGFKHILWVYSGRRGAHAWVCDKKARELTDQQRRAVVLYLSIRGKNGKFSLPRPFHPYLERSFEILNGKFVTNILVDQDPWASAEGEEKLVNFFKEPLRSALVQKWRTSNMNSVEKWKSILEVAGTVRKLNIQNVKETQKDIIIEYMFPRIDIEVSKHLNHLLKAPFCVHPGTGKVCVPIDTKTYSTFDPKNVPTIQDLLDELDDQVPNSESALKPYQASFAQFVSELLKSAKRPRDTLDF